MHPFVMLCGCRVDRETNKAVSSATQKTIQAVVVGRCATCTGNGLFLTARGLEMLAASEFEFLIGGDVERERGVLMRVGIGDSRQARVPATVEWTFV